MFNRKHLDQMVLDVELVLISVVQGVALTTLAIEAASMLRAHDPLGWTFVATGIFFVLSFWSVALIHAISFVTWPMDLTHYFCYFVLALLECLTFAQIGHPHEWFGYSIACFVLIGLLYAYDLRLILGRRALFEGSAPGRALYQHILKRQRVELMGLVPVGLVFNTVAWWLVDVRHGTALGLALMQLLLTVSFVVSFVRSFSERSRLITACIED